MSAPTVWHMTDADTMGGAERQIEVLMRLTDHSRWRPVLVHTGAEGIAPLVHQARACGAETLTMPAATGLRDGLGVALATARMIRSAQPDVIHAHLSYPLALRWQVVGALLAAGPPLIATVHSGAIMPPNRLVLLQQRLCAPKVTRYLPVSGAVREICMERLSWPGAQMTVLHNGIEPERCRDGDAAAGLEALGVADGPVVVMLSRLERDKGVFVFLEAAALLPDATFVLAGDGPEREALTARAAELDCSDRFVLPGWVDATRDVLAAASVVALPSFSEGLPISLLEAMAAGVPVVGSDIPGIAELVENERSGLLTPPGDAPALASAIGLILGDAALTARLAAEASRRVQEEFSAAKMTERVMDVYDEVTGR